MVRSVIQKKKLVRVVNEGKREEGAAVQNVLIIMKTT